MDRRCRRRRRVEARQLVAHFQRRGYFRHPPDRRLCRPRGRRGRKNAGSGRHGTVLLLIPDRQLHVYGGLRLARAFREAHHQRRGESERPCAQAQQPRRRRWCGVLRRRRFYGGIRAGRIRHVREPHRVGLYRQPCELDALREREDPFQKKDRRRNAFRDQDVSRRYTLRRAGADGRSRQPRRHPLRRRRRGIHDGARNIPHERRNAHVRRGILRGRQGYRRVHPDGRHRDAEQLVQPRPQRRHGHPYRERRSYGQYIQQRRIRRRRGGHRHHQRRWRGLSRSPSACARCMEYGKYQGLRQHFRKRPSQDARVGCVVQQQQ